MYLIGKQVNLFTSKLFIPEVTQCLSPECLFDSLTVDSLSFALKPVGMNSVKIPGGIPYKNDRGACCNISDKHPHPRR